MSVLCIPTFPRLLFSLLPPTSPPLALLSTSSLSLSHPLSPCPPCHRNSPPLPSRACRSRTSRSHPATSHRSCAGCFRSERVERHYFPPTLSTYSSSLSLSRARSLPISLCIPTPPSLLNAPCRLRHLLPTRLTSPRARADCFRCERVERHGKLALCAACCLAAPGPLTRARERSYCPPHSALLSRSLALTRFVCLSARRSHKRPRTSSKARRVQSLRPASDFTESMRCLPSLSVIPASKALLVSHKLY